MYVCTMADIILGYHLTNNEYFVSQHHQLNPDIPTSLLKKYVRM